MSALYPLHESLAQVPANDEFNDARTLSNWSNRQTVEGTANQYSTLDINTTTPGSLAIIPNVEAWYTNVVGVYLYQLATGNFVMSARVNARSLSSATQPPSTMFNSAGLLVRNPASAGVSTNQNWMQFDIGYQQTFVGLEAENTIASAQWLANRTTTNGVYSAILRICRLGNTFYMFDSLDGGNTWTQYQSIVRNDLPATLQVGLDTNAYQGPVSVRAEFDYVRFAVPNVLADCTQPMNGANDVPPTVTLTAPAGNVSIVDGTSVALSASASDSDGSVTSVAFYHGSTLIGSVASSPYNLSWVPTAPGTYTIDAVATDNAGLTTTSNAVTITVTDAPPSVTLTAPSGNISVVEGTSITLSATASDIDGTVASVGFYSGSTLLGSASASPYTVSWTASAPGTYVVEAIATDDAGLSSASSAVTITVTDAPPVVTLTAPAGNTSVVLGTIVTLSANASDADEAVSSVSFYQGSTLIRTVATSPYTINWTPPATGTYVVDAVATDASGVSMTSGSVTITVVPVPDFPPTVSLTAPSGNLTVVAGTRVPLSASASDSDGNVTSVAFYAGSTQLGSIASSPYNFNWTPTTPGTYAVDAVATDNAGMSTTSNSINVTVTDAAPTITLTAPSSNLSVPAGQFVTLSATASDIDGTIAGVSFYQGATLLGTVSSSPYSISWSSTTIGTYTIDAIATDNAGLTATSGSVTITVTPITGCPSGTSGGDLTLLSDTFTNGSLSSCWQNFNATLSTITEPPNHLIVHETVGNMWWWTTMTGGFLYQDIAGNFKVTTAAHVAPFYNPAHPGTQSLAGVMAANPTGLGTGSSFNNYVFVHTGWEGSRNVIETKTTVNSASTWMNPTFPTSSAELRLCRVGATFNTYTRAIGATTWNLFASYTRTDLPNILHVGMEQSALPQPPDMVATYDYVRFGNVSSISDCTTDP
jgi:hypothetical protein